MKRHKQEKTCAKCAGDRVINDEAVFLAGLTKALITDIAVELDVNLDRDIEVINLRTSSEGISFLTKTLPTYGKTVLSGLRSGVLILPIGFPFKKVSRSGAHPAFLQGILRLVFDEHGYERTDAPAYGIRYLEQICMMFYKYELLCTEEDKAKAFRGLLEVEESHRTTEATVASKIEGSGRVSRIAATACNLLDVVFEDYDHEKIVPRHGPGAVLESGTKQYEKFRNVSDAEFPENLECHFAKAEWGQATPAIGCTSLDAHNRLDETFLNRPIPKQKKKPFIQASRVVAVPKDSRGPRVISAEHTVDMYFQQGIWREMKGILRSHPLTKGHVNFSDQSINGSLALLGSTDGYWATIDLKEASDRVLHMLVRKLFPGHLFEDLDCTRAIQSYVMWKDNFRTIELKKFAPMGSAVCFPVESVFFWALCVATLYDYQYPAFDYETAAKNVFVYGDDIIVPSCYARLISDSLENFGLRVNTLKSYYQGWYRESCGVDAYKGEVVTPIKVKTRLPHNKSQVERILAWTEYSNSLHAGGYWHAAEYIRKHLEVILKHKIPVLPKEAGCLRLTSFCSGFDPTYKWKSAGHVGRKNGKVRLRGDGWETCDAKINFGPYAERLQVLYPKAYTIRPSEEDFSEEHAYLRWFTNNASRPCTTWEDAIFGESGGSSRVFADEENLTWRVSIYTKS